MGVIFQSSYSLPGGDQPLTHARIAHAGNWITGGTITSSSTATGYDDAAAENTLTYERWKPSALSATWTNTFAASSSFNYCVIGAHTLGTNGNSLQVLKYDGATWSNMIPTTAISSDMPIFCIFGAVTGTKAQIKITNGTAPEVGVVKFGTALQMPRTFYGGHAPLDLSRQPVLRTNVSSTGEFLGRSVTRAKYATSFAWSNLTAAWVRSNWRTFQTAVEDEPFFVAWRPDATDGFSEVGLCYATGTPIPSNMGARDLMSVQLDAVGHSYD